MSKTKSSLFSPQWEAGEHVAAEGAVSGVILGELDPQEQILKRGEQAVGDVFIKRHASAQRGAADNARAENNVIDSVGNHAGHGGYQQRRVLVVRMHHDDHVGAGGQSFAIAGLLIAAIAVVAIMGERLQAEPVRDFEGAIGAVVVDENANVDQVGQLPHRRFQCFFRVVSG